MKKCLRLINVNLSLYESNFREYDIDENITPFLTVGYIKKGEKCLFKGVFLPFKIVVWEASYEIFLIFLLSSLG